MNVIETDYEDCGCDIINTNTPISRPDLILFLSLDFVSLKNILNDLINLDVPDCGLLYIRGINSITWRDWRVIMNVINQTFY